MGSPRESSLLQARDADRFSSEAGNQARRRNAPGFFARLLDGLTANGRGGRTVEVTDNSQNTSLVEEIGGAGFAESFSDHLENAIEPDGNANAGLAVFTRDTEAGFIQGDYNFHDPGDYHSALKTAAIAWDKDLREAGLRNYASINSPIDPSREDGELNVSLKQALEVDEKRDAAASGPNANEANVKNAQNGYLQQLAGQQGEQQLENRQLSEDSRYLEAARFSDDARESGRAGRGRSNIEFRDLRTASANGVSYTELPPAQTYAHHAGAEIEIPVDLKLASIKPQEGAAGQSTFQTAFEEALAKEMRGGLSADIIRNATIIAKDGGEGIIRLALRPASLGYVKIHLEITENKITALIAVESSEALRAFGKELSVLEKAFKDSGFSEANLEMFLAQDEWNFANAERQEEDNLSSPPPLMAASRYEESEWSESSEPLHGRMDGMFLPDRTPVNLLV